MVKDTYLREELYYGFYTSLLFASGKDLTCHSSALYSIRKIDAALDCIHLNITGSIMLNFQ